jgi:hypothetical protein
LRRSHRASTTLPAIQTQKEDLKGQLSRIFEGPELREHRVCYPVVFSSRKEGLSILVVRSSGCPHARRSVWTHAPLFICKRQWHVVEDSRLGRHGGELSTSHSGRPPRVYVFFRRFRRRLFERTRPASTLAQALTCSSIAALFQKGTKNPCHGQKTLWYVHNPLPPFFLLSRHPHNGLFSLDRETSSATTRFS